MKQPTQSGILEQRMMLVKINSCEGFTVSLISFIMMQKDSNNYNYDIFSAKTYFSLVRVQQSKKKKLTLTLFCFHQKK